MAVKSEILDSCLGVLYVLNFCFAAIKDAISQADLMLVRGCAHGSKTSITVWCIVSMSRTRLCRGGDCAAMESIKALETQLFYC